MTQAMSKFVNNATTLHGLPQVALGLILTQSSDPDSNLEAFSGGSALRSTVWLILTLFGTAYWLYLTMVRTLYGHHTNTLRIH